VHFTGQGNLGPRLNIKVKAFNRVKIGGSADSGKSLRIEWHNGVSIRRVWSFLFDKNKNIGRILNSTSCFLNMLPLVFSASENSLLVFNTNPALLPLLGLIGAKLRGKKYVILIHDLWPELLASMGMIRKSWQGRLSGSWIMRRGLLKWGRMGVGIFLSILRGRRLPGSGRIC